MLQRVANVVVCFVVGKLGVQVLLDFGRIAITTSLTTYMFMLSFILLHAHISYKLLHGWRRVERCFN